MTPSVGALALSPDAAPGAAPALLAVRQLRLTDFRNYRQLRLDCGAEPVVLVGGYHLEKIVGTYPALKVYYNPDWATCGDVRTLREASAELPAKTRFARTFATVFLSPCCSINRFTRRRPLQSRSPRTREQFARPIGRRRF